MLTDSGRQETNLEVMSWGKKLESLGAGEILLTSIDIEGTGQSFDYNLIQKVSSAVSIPVVTRGDLDQRKMYLSYSKKQRQAQVVSFYFYTMK